MTRNGDTCRPDVQHNTGTINGESMGKSRYGFLRVQPGSYQLAYRSLPFPLHGIPV